MKVYVVVLNWNAGKMTAECIASLQNQSQRAEIIIIDNDSVDDSVRYLKDKFPKITLLKQAKNLGFAGGVNVGIRHAIERGADYIALFNNDAVADKDWLKNLVGCLQKNPGAGAATCKLLSRDGQHIDSTGDFYTSWGLPIARQRDVPALNAFNKTEGVFGACAGASLYRVTMLKEVGVFDETFFAYYEDTDLSFRIQLAGWKILYNPTAVAYHATGTTSSKLKGFTTYQTMKNLPMLFWKNVPRRLLPHMLPRFFVVYCAILASSLVKGRGWPAAKGYFMWLASIPYIFWQRRAIQKTKKVSTEYVWSMLIHDLPPDAHKLRRLRAFFSWR